MSETRLDLDALVRATVGHTPGPWHTPTRWDGLWAVAAGHGLDECVIASLNSNFPPDANARLIAAAPALLALAVRLRAERDEARSKLTLTYCVYCGYSVPADDAAGTKISTHIKTCPNHPIRDVEAQLAESRRKCEVLRTKISSLDIYAPDGDGMVVSARAPLEEGSGGWLIRDAVLEICCEGGKR
jgi:hypothetical protein